MAIYGRLWYRADARSIFFIDARDICPPTCPPGVPSRASMKKIKIGCSPLAIHGQCIANIQPENKKTCSQKLTIYTAYILPINRYHWPITGRSYLSVTLTAPQERTWCNNHGLLCTRGPYMPIYAPYMTIYDHIWPYYAPNMGIYAHKWPMYGNITWAIYGHIRPC